jgi:hypothetical protein
MGPRADRTIDVLGAPTRAAHQVMVVVAGARSNRAGWPAGSIRRTSPARVQAASTF